MKKQLFTVLVLIFVVLPSSFADTNQPQESNCSIFNIMQCLRDAAYLLSYSTGLAAQPFLHLIQTLMVEPPRITVFQPVWLTITAMLSVFYIFFLLYAGITFITQGDNLAKRYEAKESIKRMVIAIVLVSASFYLYTFLTDFNATLTSYMFSKINPDFFKVTSDSFGNAVLQLFLIIPYVIVLFLTSILFLARWMVASFGVLFFPIGIFLYFVPFLRNYGKLVLQILLLLLFLPFISSLLLLGASSLVSTTFFEHFTILFYIVAFLIVDFIFFLLIKFIVNVSGLGGLGKTVIAVGKYFV